MDPSAFIWMYESLFFTDTHLPLPSPGSARVSLSFHLPFIELSEPNFSHAVAEKIIKTRISFWNVFKVDF